MNCNLEGTLAKSCEETKYANAVRASLLENTKYEIEQLQIKLKNKEELVELLEKNPDIDRICQLLR